MTTVILLAEREFSRKAKDILKRAGRVVGFISAREFKNNLSRAHVLVTGLEVKCAKDLLDRAPSLILIGTRTTQLRYIDMEECARRGIRVVSIQSDSPILRRIPSTAEETIALLLALVRNIPWAFDSVMRHRWERQKYGGRELFKKTCGIIGFGRLGKLVSGYARAFGMRVIAYDPYVTREDMERYHTKKVNLETLLVNSDVVSLHCVYNADTKNLLRRKHFRLMKPHAVLINTARGEVTDEGALLEALEKQWIAGAALDTLGGEMPDGSHLKNHPLVSYAKRHDNLIIVPHLGGATKEATERTQVYIAQLVARALRTEKYGKNKNTFGKSDGWR